MESDDRFLHSPRIHADAKRRYNTLLLGAYPEFRESVRRSRQPFQAAARMAIGGNIIDFGSNHGLDEQRVLDTLTEVRHQPLAIDGLARLQAAVESARQVLYLADNAGEIVLDRLFIEQFPAATRVTVAVKDGPILNDATTEDARAVGMDECAQVISNGFDAPGTVLPKCSKEFRNRFDAADVVISKGQGNYETLAGCGRENLFYMLKVKCQVVSRQLGVPEGSIVVFSEDRTAPG